MTILKILAISLGLLFATPTLGQNLIEEESTKLQYSFSIVDIARPIDYWVIFGITNNNAITFDLQCNYKDWDNRPIALPVMKFLYDNQDAVGIITVDADEIGAIDKLCYPIYDHINDYLLGKIPAL